MIETPKPIRAHYLILRRNTGELLLTTEEDLGTGHVEGRPSVHQSAGRGDYCYGAVPGPSQPAPQHKVFDGFNAETRERIERDCRCRCHTRKGLREWKAELIEFGKKARDPGVATYTFEGGSSMGVNLARRVRRVSADKQRRLQQLDAKIAKLQRERTAIIPALWGDSDVLTAIDLAKIAATPQAKKGPSRRLVESALEAKNTISPEGQAR